MTISLHIFSSSQPYHFCGPTAFCIDLYSSIAHTREYIVYEDLSLLNCDPFKDGNCALLCLLPLLTRTETGILQAEPGKCWLSNWAIYSDVAGVAYFWIWPSLGFIWYYTLCMCISGTSYLMKWLTFLIFFGLFLWLKGTFVAFKWINSVPRFQWNTTGSLLWGSLRISPIINFVGDLWSSS